MVCFTGFGAEGCVKNLKMFFFVFSRPIIKGEVLPLLGKWILIKYWSAAVSGYSNDTFYNYTNQNINKLYRDWHHLGVLPLVPGNPLITSSLKSWHLWCSLLTGGFWVSFFKEVVNKDFFNRNILSWKFGVSILWWSYASVRQMDPN